MTYLESGKCVDITSSLGSGSYADKLNNFVEFLCTCGGLYSVGARCRLRELECLLAIEPVLHVDSEVCSQCRETRYLGYSYIDRDFTAER